MAQQTQQTAVQFLIEQLKPIINYSSLVLEINHIAEEMEKHQHGITWDAAINAHEIRGHVIARSICDFDEFYNETYGK